MLEQSEWSASRKEVSVDALGPPHIVLVQTADQLRLWRSMMEQFHYLPPRRGSMGTLKYLVYQENRPVGALSFAGAGYKLKTRDDLLKAYGLSRKEAEGQLVVNSRFLILPYIRVKNLASAILGRVVKQLVQDWQTRFGKPPLLVETFVDPERFKGTCYRAANWVFWGYTEGSRRKGKGYVYHGKKKAIFLYPLEASLRQLMLREQKSIVGKRAELNTPLEPDIDTRVWQPERELSGTSHEQIRELARLLVAFHSYFRPAFTRKRQEEFGLTYLGGLLSAIDRKNSERLASYLLGTKRVRSMQRFLKDSPWDEEMMRALLHEKVAEELAEPDGILVVDPSEFPKRGTESVGVARQYCGRLGKLENCQCGVFASYVSSQGHCLVGARLYLPKEWFSKKRRQRWHRWGIPKNTCYLPKTNIAIDMIGRIKEEGRLPFRWVACDAFLGAQPDWLERLPKDVWFMAQIHSDTLVWPEKPTFRVPPYKGRGRRPSRPVASTPALKVRELLKKTNLSWKKIRLSVGKERPVVYHLLIRRVWLCHRKKLKGPFWLIIRLKRKGDETKYYLSNAPETVDPEELKRVLLRRWEIEHCFHLGKGRLGMSDYQMRSWPGWHRHMLYVQLAFLFLIVVRHHFKKNSAHHSGANTRHRLHCTYMADPDT